jgi:hypothetical protein
MRLWIRRILGWGFRVGAGVSFALFLVTVLLWVQSYTWHPFVLSYYSHPSQPSIRTTSRCYDIHSAKGGFLMQTYPEPERWAEQISGRWSQPILRLYSPPGWGGDLTIDSFGGRWYWRIWVWYRNIALPTAILPAVWARRALKNRRIANRRKQGACTSCGYDLRATPNRCPECGTVVAAGGER